MTNPLILDTLSIRDFGAAGLLSSISLLSYRVTTTSTAYMQNPFPGAFTNALLEAGKIYLTTLSPEELHYAFQLSSTLPGLTLAEYSVLYLASRDQGTLVTVDPCIIRAADVMRLKVCNYSLVLQQLASEGIIGRELTDDHFLRLLGKLNTLAGPRQKQHVIYTEVIDKERLA